MLATETGIWCTDNIYAQNVIFIINMAAWNKIPPNLQQVVMDVSAEHEPQQLDVYQKVIDDGIVAAKGRGMQMIDLSPAETKTLIDTAYNSAWADMIKKSPDYGPKLQKVSSK